MKKLALLAAAPALAVTVSLAPASTGAAPLPDTDSDAAGEPRADAFNLATFNAVGGSHTDGRGGMRSGSSRMKGAVSYLRRHKVSLAGLQELEPSQASAFRKQPDGRWGLVGAPSRSGKSTDTRNSVAYKKSRFSVVKKRYVPITYFHGKRVNIPLVALKSKRNGKVFWILNTHNPADTHGSAHKWRAESVRRELKKIKRPPFPGAHGAVHRRHECEAGVLLHRDQVRPAALGLRRSVGKPCRYPRANGIDWLLGTRDVRFRNWSADKSTRSRGVSDHPFVVAGATLQP